MNPPLGWTLTDYAAAYAAGASAVDLVGAVLDALAGAPEGVLIGGPLRDAALAQATLLDAAPERGPLHGVPFLVKDNIDVADVPTTAACPGFAYTAAADAEVITRLRAAGAVPVGKANLDQFATGLVGTRSPFGIPPNVLDSRLVPGGSSSGSAVGVGLGLVPFALGTDTAGSGRVPAAMNGIVGWKPSVGAASTRGIVPAVRRFDCPSVFARTVADAAVVASIIDGYDPADPFSRHPEDPAIARPARRVGVVVDWPAGAEPDDDVGEAYAAAIQLLIASGCEIVGVDPAPLFHAGDLLYSGPIVAERYVSVGAAIEAGIDGVHPVVRSIIERSTALTAADAYEAEYRLARLRRSSDAVFATVDVLALPTVPHALTLEEALTEPFGTNERAGRYTTFVNLLDLAAVVVPIASGPEAAPFGLQLVGPRGADASLGRLAGRLAGEPAGPPEPVSTATTSVVVVGAHLTGQPLNGQLVELGATLVAPTLTAPAYRIYALADTVPPKPGLVRVGPGDGHAIAVEVWALSFEALGRFLNSVPFPLALGQVELADGSSVVGFVAQPAALDGARDITEFGGWVAYLAAGEASPLGAPG